MWPQAATPCSSDSWTTVSSCPPKAQKARTVVQGEAFYDTLTVPMLKHYAEDAGKSQAEIDAITEPELRLAFTATGVMIEG